MHHKPLWFWLVLWLCSVAAYGQEAVTLTATQLAHGQAVELDKLGWKYSPDDDPRFAEPQFDDRAWETLNGTAITLDNIPQSGWRGIGWFRLRLNVDPALANQPLALVMVHFGASEIYLDGKLIERFGTVGTTPETEVAYNPNTLPFNLILDGRNEHVLAVRHSCMVMQDLSGAGGRWFARMSRFVGFRFPINGTINYGAGIGIRILESQPAFAEHLALKSVAWAILIVISLSLALGAFHLLLYWFYPNQPSSFMFGLGALLAFAAGTNGFLGLTTHSWAAGTVFPFFLSVVLSFWMLLFFLGFYYLEFFARLPKWYWTLALVGSLIDFLFLLQPSAWTQLLMVLLRLGILWEGVRVMIQAIRRRAEGAWILGVGILAGALVLSAAGILGATGILPTEQLRLTIPVAGLATSFAIAIYLAHHFARTSRGLAAQLVQVQQLSEKELEHQRTEAELRIQHAQEKAENDRRAAELEEARQLQLSMLPKKLPELPHLDIAAYMKTASEVGGDYYDFHTSDDGTLTVAVGDATGHGLKAGTLVSGIKTLFVSLAYHPDIPHIFARMSRVLKEMKLRGLFMAMTMVKLRGSQLTVSIAGMPSVLIYRAASQSVEEIAMRALPLGGMTKYQYQQQELTLAVDDVVVLMSDGLPERFNPQGEMLEDARIREALPACAPQSAAEIIAALVRLGEEWSEGRPQDDDVTFVVLKLR